MRRRANVVFGFAAAIATGAVLAIACGGSSTPQPAAAPNPHPSAVVVTIDAGEAPDSATAAMNDAAASGQPAPTASISTTGEEGPPSGVTSPEKAHVFVRVNAKDPAKSLSVDVYGDGRVVWKGPGCPKGQNEVIAPAKVKSLLDDLHARKFFDMQPVSGHSGVPCDDPESTTVHADGVKLGAERSANICSNAAQKRSVLEWKERVLSYVGAMPKECLAR